ncbi:FkbM family methyltransferase [Mucilaginibacter sp.]|uniref:FkbM family methyltransferase n=1 Tax=Mucilaginibacter sp. TaxID=1882438 RepID=UPI002848216F|nr:FkbM family methyltransferase [Mucilaginibacter sp.]MDR3695465.1 FkbM family methyltransferase [Mucilaginibacter sp.]
MSVSLDEITFSYLRPDYIILEAGAHDGNDTKRLAALTKNKVFAFEPVPFLFGLLKRNTNGLKNVFAFDIALADKNTTLPMYISSGGSDASSSLLKPAAHLDKNPEVVFDEKINVKALTLDDWAALQHVTNIDFMWLDMQGYEFNMLKASKIIFPTIKVLYTEVSTTELYLSQVLYSEYKEWLLNSGFDLIKEDLPWGFTGNALFVKK